MEVRIRDDGRVELTVAVKEGDKLADVIIQHAEALTSAELELSSLLKEAKYASEDDFRQPPHAFDAQAASPPSVED